ncbi:MAG: hypothetical protein ACI9B9_000468 [Halioglobus sp.]|jgi:hypothetical protein
MGDDKFRATNQPVSLGWREWIELPALGISHIKAKVDTGARTSALHAFHVEPFVIDSEQWVRFSIHPNQGDSDTIVECEASVVDQRVVRDSGGHEELRYVIRTELRIGGNVANTEMTLTNRDDMRFRVLLGRTLLREKFLVDSGKSYLTGRRVKKKRGKLDQLSEEE